MIAKINSADFGIIAEIGRRPRGENLAALDDVGAVGHAQGLAHLVIGDQHADPLTA